MEASLWSIAALPLDQLCPSDARSLPEHAALAFHLQKQADGGLLSKPPRLRGCTVSQGAEQDHAQGKGWAEVFPVHKLCLRSKALLEVAPGLAGAWRAPAGTRVGCDRTEPGRRALARLLVPNCSLGCRQPLCFGG